MHGNDNCHSLIVMTLIVTACCVGVYCSALVVLKCVKMNFNVVCTVHRTGILIYVTEFTCTKIYRVSQEECARLRESVPYVKLYRYNPKHLYPKLNGYGDNGQRNLKL